MNLTSPAPPVHYVRDFDSLRPDGSLRRIGVHSTWKEAIISTIVFWVPSNEKKSPNFKIELWLDNGTKAGEDKELNHSLLLMWLDDCRIDYKRESPVIILINDPYSARKLLGLLAKSHQISDSAYLPAKKAAEDMRLKALEKK